MPLFRYKVKIIFNENDDRLDVIDIKDNSIRSSTNIEQFPSSYSKIFQEINYNELFSEDSKLFIKNEIQQTIDFKIDIEFERLIEYPGQRFIFNFLIINSSDSELTLLITINEFHRDLFYREHELELIQFFPNPIFLKDVHGRYLIFNKAFTDLTGIESNKLKYCANDEIFDPKVREFFNNEECINDVPTKSIKWANFRGDEYLILTILTKINISGINYILGELVLLNELRNILLKGSFNNSESHLKNDIFIREEAINKALLVSTSDISGNITSINDNFIEVCGYKKEELLGKNHSIFKSGFHNRAFWVNFWQTIRSGNTWRGLIKNLDKNGVAFWTDTVVVPQANQDSIINGYYSIRFNVTREHANREYNNLLTIAIQQSSLLVIITDADANITFVNDYFLEVTGFNKEEVIGKNPRIISSGTNDPEVYVNMWDNLNNNKTWAGELKNKKKNGDIFNVKLTITPVRDDNGVILNYVAIEEDTTLLDKNHTELKLFKKLAESSNQGIGMTDVDGKVTYTNPVIKEITGISDFTNTQIEDYFHIDDRPLLNDTILPSIFEKSFWTGEINFQSSNNDKVPVIANLFLIKDKFLNPIQIAGVITDLREQKNKEEELKRALMELDNINQSKISFMNNISHEMRTPLNSIIGLSHLLSNTQTSENISLNKIKSAANQLLDVVNDSIQTSKLETSQYNINNEYFSIDKLVQDLYNKYVDQALKKGINLYYEISSNVPKLIRADLSKYYVILMHLISNGIKFTHSGFVSIKCFVKKESDSYQLVFSIEDTGIGVAQKEAAMIFNPFWQADQSLARNYNGLGIGLTISNQLASLLEGDIWYVNKPDTGTTFYFSSNLKTLPNEIPTFINKNYVILLLLDSYDLFEISNYFDNSNYSIDSLNNIDELLNYKFVSEKDYLLISSSKYTSNKLNILNKVNLHLVLLSDGADSSASITINNIPYQILYRPFKIDTFSELVSNFESAAFQDEPLVASHVTDISICVDTEVLRLDELDNYLQQYNKRFNLNYIDCSTNITSVKSKVNIAIVNNDPNASYANNLLHYHTIIYMNNDKTELTNYNIKTMFFVKSRDEIKEIVKKIIDIHFRDNMMINLKEGLRRCGGNKKLFNKLLIKFRDKYSDFIINIIESYNSNEHNVFLRELHTLKGTSAQLGMEDLNLEAINCENFFKNNQIAPTINNTSKLQTQLQLVLITLDQTIYDDVETTTTNNNIEQILEELTNFLEKRNFKSTEVFNSNIKLFESIMSPAEFNSLEEAISDYRFDDALNIIKSFFKPKNP